MSEKSITALMILVERIVRPLRAGASRKHAIREELLGHATLIFEEELARLGDDQVALRQTSLRLGDPLDVTGQLQRIVPASDRFRSMVDRIWSRPGERGAVRALRQAMMIEILLPTIPLGAWLAAGAPALGQANIFLPALPDLLVVAGVAFSFPFLALWMRRVLVVPRSRPLIHVLPICIATGAAFVAWGVWLSGTPLELLLMAFFGAVWAPIALISLAQASLARDRREAEWSNLIIA